MSKNIANNIIKKIQDNNLDVGEIKNNEIYEKSESNISEDSIRITRKIVMENEGLKSSGIGEYNDNKDEILVLMKDNVYSFYNNFLAPNFIIILPIIFVLIFVIIKYYTKKNKKDKLYKSAYKKYKKEKYYKS